MMVSVPVMFYTPSALVSPIPGLPWDYPGTTLGLPWDYPALQYGFYPHNCSG